MTRWVKFRRVSHRYGVYIGVSFSALSFSYSDDAAEYRGSNKVLPLADWPGHTVVAEPQGTAVSPERRLTPSQQYRSTHLCLERVYETPVADLEPIALSTSEAEAVPPTVTMWSHTTLVVIRVSPEVPTVESTFRVTLPTRNPLAAAVVGWQGGAPTIEVLDAANGTVWNLGYPDLRHVDQIMQGPPPAGAMRTAKGWVQAVRTADASGDSLAIGLVGAGLDDQAVEGSPAVARARQRNIDQIMHVRPGAHGAVLVTEAAFPFTTVAFTPEGVEFWRASPSPQELRDRLGEVDLRYVVATPGVDVDGGVLNTYVGLRSLRRLSALRLHDGTVRYEEIPGDLAFLGSFPRHRLLVATRNGHPYKLVLFRWRWTDQRQSCTTRETGRLQ